MKVEDYADKYRCQFYLSAYVYKNIQMHLGDLANLEIKSTDQLSLDILEIIILIYH